MRDVNIQINDHVFPNNNTLLHSVVEANRSSDAVMHLISLGADIFARNKDGLTPLDFALKIKETNSSVYLLMLEMGFTNVFYQIEEERVGKGPSKVATLLYNDLYSYFHDKHAKEVELLKNHHILHAFLRAFGLRKTEKRADLIVTILTSLNQMLRSDSPLEVAKLVNVLRREKEPERLKENLGARGIKGSLVLSLIVKALDLVDELQIIERLNEDDAEAILRANLEYDIKREAEESAMRKVQDIINQRDSLQVELAETKAENQRNLEARVKAERIANEKTEAEKSLTIVNTRLMSEAKEYQLALVEKDGAIQILTRQLDERDRQIAEQNAVNAEQKAVIAEQKAVNAAQRSQLEEQNKLNEEQKELNRKQKSLLEASEKRSEASEETVSEQKAYIITLQAATKASQEQIALLQSWFQTYQSQALSVQRDVAPVEIQHTDPLQQQASAEPQGMDIANQSQYEADALKYRQTQQHRFVGSSEVREEKATVENLKADQYNHK